MAQNDLTPKEQAVLNMIRHCVGPVHDLEIPMEELRKVFQQSLYDTGIKQLTTVLDSIREAIDRVEDSIKMDSHLVRFCGETKSGAAIQQVACLWDSLHEALIPQMKIIEENLAEKR